MVSTRACLEPCLCMVLCRWRTPHVWLGSIRPRSQCVGGMLLVQWCYQHVLELSQGTGHRPIRTPERPNRGEGAGFGVLASRFLKQVQLAAGRGLSVLWPHQWP